MKMKNYMFILKKIHQLPERLSQKRSMQPEPETPQDPALMLGDPSDLRLRDPGETLQLDLDQ